MRLKNCGHIISQSSWLNTVWPVWFKHCSIVTYCNKKLWKMLGPFATASRLTPIHQVSQAVLSRATCASMSTTTTTTTAWQRGPLWPNGMGPMTPHMTELCNVSMHRVSWRSLCHVFPSFYLACLCSSLNYVYVKYQWWHVYTVANKKTIP